MTQNGKKYSFKAQWKRSDKWDREHKVRGIRIDSLKSGQRFIAADGIRGTFQWRDSETGAFRVRVESCTVGSRMDSYGPDQGGVLVLPLR